MLIYHGHLTFERVKRCLDLGQKQATAEAAEATMAGKAWLPGDCVPPQASIRGPQQWGRGHWRGFGPLFVDADASYLLQLCRSQTR
jgi:hypothetical protein